jgi:hypothetical protein
MNIVIFNPAASVIEKYKIDREIIFYDENGWWLVNENERVCCGKENNIQSNELHLRYSVADVIKGIREFGPLWSRWISRGDQYELLYRDALCHVLEISYGLKKYKIKKAIFNSGVTHHLSTMIFEIACALTDVKQVFLYTNNIMLGRLLPLIQEKNIKDRYVLNRKVSDEEAQSYIKRFHQNKLLGNTPEKGGELPTRREESFVFACLYLSLDISKNIVRMFKNRILNNQKVYSELNIYYDYTPSIFLKQIIQQYLAISFYKKNANKSLLGSILPNDKCSIVIAAHFQPEATSFPEGWDCHNNVDIVLELRNLGYKDKVLYKEHPATFMYRAEGVGSTRVSIARSSNYYKQLLRLGCEFIDTTIELSLTLVGGNYLPVTITGTIAIERSLAGLHTIVTGHPWYSGLPGCLHINEINSLKEIKEHWYTPDPELAKRAFKFLDELLSRNTIVNTLGYGIGKPSHDNYENEVFLKEFDSLINTLKEL